MNSKIRFGIFIAGTISALFLAFVLAQTVHAEDIVTPTPEVTPTETATPSPTESMTPAPIDPTPIETSSPVPSESPAPDPSAIPEPDGGEMMLAMGSPMLMGPITNGPVWYNSSVGVQPFTTINDAWVSISNGLLPTDGLIHLDASYGMDTAEADPPIEFYPTVLVSPTSIKGLLGPDLDSASLEPVVRINSALSIFGFSSGFTISNIIFSGSAGNDIFTEGVVKITDIDGNVKLSNLDIQNSDSRGLGLVVQTNSGSITIINVDSSDNEGGGAYLKTKTSGSVTISNSSFDNNKGVLTGDGTVVAGLVIETNSDSTTLHSPVSLNGVSANGNTSYGSPGVLIKKSGALTVKNSMFNNNLGGGLANKQDPATVTIQGATVLDNVTASDNYISTPDVRGGSGIELHTNGSITANNIYATGNLKYGMKLDNCNFLSSLCQSSVIGSVSVSNSEFSDNLTSSGLEIQSRGQVTLMKVKANNNPGAPGVLVDNHFGTAGVSINGSAQGDNLLTGNGEDLGDINRAVLEVFSKGNILVNYVQSGTPGEGNHLSGAIFNNVDGKGTITVNNSTFRNNDGSGLILRSKNTITLKNISTDDNLGDLGVDLDNYAAGNGTGNVVINGSSMLNNGRRGLSITTKGSVSIGTTNASENPEGGAVIDDQSVVVKPITITKSFFNNNKSGLNNGTGLTISSIGNITLTGVGASGNGLGGFELLDTRINIGNVVINNTLNPLLYNYSGNSLSGLKITTNGSVTLTAIYADNSTSGGGAWIDNSNGVKSVSISTSHFNGNLGGDGLFVKSEGAISLTKTSASGNSGWGAALHNDLAGFGILAISINNDALKIGSGLNGFSGNGDGGLDIGARGPVTLTNVEANGNTGSGAFVNNFAGSPADLKITNSYFDFNDDGVGGGYGLFVESKGNITLSGGSASGNYLYGAHLDNQRGAAFPIMNITISKFDFNNNETGFGLEAHANGTITITSVKVDDNGTYGAHLDNRLEDPLLKDSGMGLVVKTSSFSLNDAGIGLEIQTAGSVVLDGVSANTNNGGEGIKVTSIPQSPSIKPVTVNRTFANGNSLDGLKVDAVGLITLNGVTANGNSLTGAVLDNSSVSITSGVTILSSLGANYFNNNEGDFGLSTRTRGQVSLSLVTANYNLGGTGVGVDNCMGGAPGCGQANVSFSKVTTRLNRDDGMLIHTNALTITMNGLVSLSNESGSGIKITSNNSLAKISLLNSLFMGNGAYGIDLDRTGSNALILTGTSYFGNTMGNLYIH
jgi:hypothetical protein